MQKVAAHKFVSGGLAITATLLLLNRFTRVSLPDWLVIMLAGIALVLFIIGGHKVRQERQGG